MHGFVALTYDFTYTQSYRILSCNNNFAVLQYSLKKVLLHKCIVIVYLYIVMKCFAVLFLPIFLCFSHFNLCCHIFNIHVRNMIYLRCNHMFCNLRCICFLSLHLIVLVYLGLYFVLLYEVLMRVIVLSCVYCNDLYMN